MCVMGDTTPRPSWQWAGRLCCSWSYECYGQSTQERGAPIQFRNPLETRISLTSLYLDKAHMEDHLWALHHHLAHSGYVHHEAVCQWSVRGYKTLQCNSLSLESKFGFFKFQLRKMRPKASHGNVTGRLRHESWCPCKDLFVYGNLFHFGDSKYLLQKEMLCEVRLSAPGCRGQRCDELTTARNCLSTPSCPSQTAHSVLKEAICTITFFQQTFCQPTEK